MPKASIEKALKDAKGEKGDLDIEILWEVRGPARAAVLVELLCKNRSMVQVWILLVPKASEASDGDFLFFYQL